MPVLNVTPPSPVMKGATSTSKGAAGLVPAPLSGDQAQFLRGDGSWGTPAVATTSANGLMSASDKAKLDGINLDSINMDAINSAIQGKQDKITAGSGLSFSGTTLNHVSSITAGTKGSATAIPVITYDASGHITGATTAPTSLPFLMFPSSNFFFDPSKQASGRANFIWLNQASRIGMIIGEAVPYGRTRMQIRFGYGAMSNAVTSVVVNSGGTKGTANLATPATLITFAHVPFVMISGGGYSDDTDGYGTADGVVYITPTFFNVSNADTGRRITYIAIGIVA